MLRQLIDDPTETGFAPSNPPGRKPYIRFELHFHPSLEDTATSAAAESECWRTREEKSKETDPYQLAMQTAELLRDAFHTAHLPLKVKYTVIEDYGNIPGTNVSFFLYSDAHTTPAGLQQSLRDKRSALLQRADALCAMAADPEIC